jgi:RimJ/RimL family protein N-acetyltransferase
MGKNLFEGRLVRLTAEDAATIAETEARWARSSAFARLLDSEPARLFSQKSVKEAIDKELDKEPSVPAFGIRTIAGNALIGYIGAWGLCWQHGDTFFGMGIGDEAYWSKGYGTEALRLFLRYAFRELNLRRVSLDVFSYNPRALRCYEKCGFRVEGRIREAISKEGKRHDDIYMGILREEWEQLDYVKSG